MRKPTTSGFARAVLAATCAIVLLFGCAALAFADEAVSVWGSQTQLTQSDAQASDATVHLNVLGFSGPKGETVFLSVKRDGKEIATFLPHQLGETLNDSSAQQGAGLADTFAITAERSTLEKDLANGVYTVDVYQSRADRNPQRFAVHGVWAELTDANGKSAGEVLIGTITTGGKQQASFSAIEYLTHDGRAYELQGAAGAAGGSASSASAASDGNLYYAYSEIASGGGSQLSGSVKYVDEQGQTVSVTKVANLPADGAPVAQSIPKAVVGDDGKAYRTLTNLSQVQLKSPDATTFTVLCSALSDANATEAGHYLANILFVDDKGNVIARDSLNVKGSCNYTAPATIYKKRPAADNSQKSRVFVYELADDAQITQTLVPTPGDSAERTITVRYNAKALEALETQVTYNLIDGQKRDAPATAKQRNLGADAQTVDEANPTASAPAEITVNGTTYVLAGDAKQYEYEYGSGEVPVIDAYYVPKGYEAQGDYQVTVNYVNFADGSIITSETGTSSPDQLSDMEITTPEQFEEAGVTYVRLPGQADTILHNYYSHKTTYTVYYRDRTKTLGSDATVSRTRVVYRDQQGQGQNQQNQQGQNQAQQGQNQPGQQQNPGASGSAANPDAATTSAQLNPDSTYSVTDGSDSNQNLTNDEGNDSNTERIEDEEVALSSGADAAAATEGVPMGAMVAIVVAALAIVAVLLAIWRRRKTADK